jgi:hypothetical protein
MPTEIEFARYFVVAFVVVVSLAIFQFIRRFFRFTRDKDEYRKANPHLFFDEAISDDFARQFINKTPIFSSGKTFTPYRFSHRVFWHENGAEVGFLRFEVCAGRGRNGRVFVSYDAYYRISQSYQYIPFAIRHVIWIKRRFSKSAAKNENGIDFLADDKNLRCLKQFVLKWSNCF